METENISAIAVARCPSCDWTDACGPAAEDAIALGARLQEHLVADHEWAFVAAVFAARDWLLGLLKSAAAE